MQHFAKGRGGRPITPQNERQATAAITKIPMKNGVPSGLPARGVSNAQNSSAPMQPGPQRRVSGQPQGHGVKRDPFDTDAESIDTTVNQSVVQVEDSKQRYQQHQHNGQVAGDGEVSDDDEEEYEEEEYEDFDDYVFTKDNIEYLRHNNLLHLSHNDKIGFLQQAARDGGLPTVDGDSYPTTTNGEPSELGGGQEAPSDYHDEGGPVSPSPQRPNLRFQSTRPFASQPQKQQQQPNMPLPSHGMQKQTSLFQQAAGFRDQARSTVPHAQYAGQNAEHYTPAQPSSQPPTHSQANLPIVPAIASHAFTHPNAYGQVSKSSQHASRQLPGPSRSQVQFQATNTKPVEPQALPKRLSSARAKPEPVVQQPPVEQASIEEVQAGPDGDYDHDTLFQKQYDDLKNEDFDTDPRAKPAMLHEEDLQKPLEERLDIVQKNLDAGQQSDYFRSLPTAEWEEAGDWFLDQFSSIIQRTKQARQSKRKLAQGFEDEVEKRHKHVSKKQHQVEQAMDRMKAQGEGLVPRSPRPSKSPRPKRG
jgi:hypothetical protein